jgi:two-component system, cell cycle sensor histidine kinase and response regulator CckA
VGNSIIPGGSETVLVVEDEDAVLRLIQGLLGGRGYTVLGAATAGEAIATCDTTPGPIDLLLVDLNLPDMDGQELAERLRVRRPEMKLLYMSGHGDRAMELGILPYGRLFLPKPFTLYELAWRVREVLDADAT